MGEFILFSYAHKILTLRDRNFKSLKDGNKRERHVRTRVPGTLDLSMTADDFYFSFVF